MHFLVDGELVEIKTQQHAMVGHFWRKKSLSWWLQSFLIGIKTIVVGFRDNHGIVKKWVGSVRTEDLPKRGEWNGNACLNLLSSVLSTVRSQLSSDGLACVVRFDPIKKHISLQAEPFKKNYPSTTLLVALTGSYFVHILDAHISKFIRNGAKESYTTTVVFSVFDECKKGVCVRK
uniref:Decapping nuclease n=1 Tax=Heterorhabditis bacteriophora TaxID=37862 RepID=A0A1I7WS65_HETBA